MTLPTMNSIRDVFTAGGSGTKGPAPVSSTPKPGKGKDTGVIGKAFSPEKIEEILATGMTTIESAIINNEPINEADFRKVIYLALFGPGSKRNVAELAVKIEIVEENLDEIDKRTKRQGTSLALMKNKVVGLECEAYKNKYLLKNVPIKGTAPGASRETFEETQNSVTEILRAAEMNANSTDDFFRLYPKKGKKNLRPSADQTNTKPKTANIFIKFSGQRQAIQFHTKLAEIREIELYKDIQLERMCPPSLISDWNLANKEAFRMRKEKKMSTKTDIRDNKVILLVKNKGDPNFIQVQIPTAEMEISY